MKTKIIKRNKKTFKFPYFCTAEKNQCQKKATQPTTSTPSNPSSPSIWKKSGTTAICSWCWWKKTSSPFTNKRFWDRCGLLCNLWWQQQSTWSSSEISPNYLRMEFPRFYFTFPESRCGIISLKVWRKPLPFLRQMPECLGKFIFRDSLCRFPLWPLPSWNLPYSSGFLSWCFCITSSSRMRFNPTGGFYLRRY